MRKNAFLLPISAIILGIGGFLLRRSELAEVYDPASGLFLSHTGITTALILLSAAVFIYCLILCVWIGKRYVSPAEFSCAFHQKTPAYLVLVILVAAGWLVCTALQFMDRSSDGTFTAIDIVFALLSILGAVAVVAMAAAAKRGKAGGGAMFWSLIPPIFTCFWIVLFYREHASTPALLKYSFTYLAIAFSTLAFYYNASYAYGKPAAGRATLSCMMAIFFSAVIAADLFTPLYVRILFLVIAAYHALNSGLLIRNLRKKLF